MFDYKFVKMSFMFDHMLSANLITSWLFT